VRQYTPRHPPGGAAAVVALRQPPHAHEQRLAERGRGRVRLVREVERRLAGDGRVGAAVDLGEDPVERALDRVREDVRPGHHRDAEDDRDRGEDRAELPAEQACEGDAGHEMRFIAARISDGSLTAMWSAASYSDWYR